jgi:hypothetical protein
MKWASEENDQTPLKTWFELFWGREGELFRSLLKWSRLKAVANDLLILIALVLA